METFCDVIELWPTTVDFCEDLEVCEETGKSWKRRNSIPPGWWLETIRMAKERRYRGVNLKLLAGFAEQKQLSK